MKETNEGLCGIICIDKPADFTSFDVIAKSRGILRQRKVGHAGTLDPMATGVLPLFLGRATKCCDILPIEQKRYTATFRLGLTTDTQDITGTVLEQRPVQVTREQLEAVMAQFTGELQQLPPMYSAVQVDGRRLYDLARQGIEVERKPRPVTIHSLSLLEGDGVEFTADVLCSKGTYVRTLFHDIGRQLGCGAALTALRRTMSSGWGLEHCVTLTELQEICNEGRVEEILLPLESAFASLPRVELSKKQATMYRNGVKLSLARLQEMGKLPEEARESDLAVYCGELFLGISRADFETDDLLTRKLFAIRQEG